MTDEQAAEAGNDEAEVLAAQAVDPCVTSAVAVAAFWTNGDEAIDFKPTYAAIQRQVQEVKRGKLAGVEATLIGHAPNCPPPRAMAKSIKNQG